MKINLLGENCPGGIQDQSGLKDNLDKLAKELTGIKSKLDKELTGIKSKLDTQLPEIKSKLSKIESDVAGLQGGQSSPESSNNSEKCPMCIRVVMKPMRLQQCPRVRSLRLS